MCRRRLPVFSLRALLPICRGPLRRRRLLPLCRRNRGMDCSIPSSQSAVSGQKAFTTDCVVVEHLRPHDFKAVASPYAIPLPDDRVDAFGIGVRFRDVEVVQDALLPDFDGRDQLPEVFVERSGSTGCIY